MVDNKSPEYSKNPFLELEIKTKAELEFATWLKEEGYKPENQRIIGLTKDERHIIRVLTIRLGLSFRSLINAAIRGSLDRADNLGISVAELPEYPKEIGSGKTEVGLTADTLEILKEFKAEKLFNECALAGVYLMYKTFYPNGYKE